MSNPFNALNQANSINMNNIRGAYQMLTQSRNPMQIFQQLAMRNPALQPAMSMLRQCNNPQQVFNTICQQKGINPQEFMKNIMGN